MNNLLMSAFICVCAFTTPSFAMLETEFQETYSFSYGTSKDLYATGQTSPHRNALYNANYPSLPMVHSYHHTPVPAPFSAFLPDATVPEQLNTLLTTFFPNHEIIFSFIVQGMEPMEMSIQPHYSLKPQYLIEPESPSHALQDITCELQWAILAGQEGEIKPEVGNGLLKETVSIHPIGRNLRQKFPLVKVSDIKDAEEKARVEGIIAQKNLTLDSIGRINMDDVNDVSQENRFSTQVELKKIPVTSDDLVDMDDFNGIAEWARISPEFLILSSDSMHLSNIDPHKSADFYSLIAFQKESRSIAAITYHWLLNEKDLEDFNDTLIKSKNLRALLENLKEKPSFLKRLEELNTYLKTR